MNGSTSLGRAPVALEVFGWYAARMNLVSLDFSLDGYPDVHVSEGQVVRGVIRGGKLHVTVAAQDETSVSSGASQAFVTKWSGQGRLLTTDQMGEDARLAALTAKHVH
jgi:hypothetical protein